MGAPGPAFGTWETDNCNLSTVICEGAPGPAFGTWDEGCRRGSLSIRPACQASRSNELLTRSGSVATGSYSVCAISSTAAGGAASPLMAAAVPGQSIVPL